MVTDELHDRIDNAICESASRHGRTVVVRATTAEWVRVEVLLSAACESSAEERHSYGRVLEARGQTIGCRPWHVQVYEVPASPPFTR